MIAYLKGTLIRKKEHSIILDVNQVGYELFVPLSMIGQLPSRGEVITVHTYQYVREDALMLYGFMTEADLEVFKKLITVNGIGPKGALALLSAITIDELKFAIISEDDAIISRAPGIGKKTAQRLIIDLKDKLDLTGFNGSIDPGLIDDRNGIEVNPKQEAIEALVSLGYPSSIAVNVVKKITTYSDVEDILKQALKQLAIL